jgi:hypothetical protein
VNIAGGAPPSGLGNVAVASGTGAVPAETKEYWHTYDGESRILVNNATLQNGQIVLTLANEDSYSLAYNAAGNVVSRTTNRTANGLSLYWIDRTSYDLRGSRQFEYYTDTIRNGVFEAGGGIRKQLTYDAANHMTASLSYFAANSYWVHETGTGPGEHYEYYDTYYYGGWLSAAETCAYDGDGRITVQQTLKRSDNRQMWLMGNANVGGRESTDLGVLDFSSGTDYAGGYDVLGRMVSYRYVTPQYTHTYTTTYEGRENWLQKTVTATSSNSSYRTTTNTLTYDAYGRLLSQRETTPLQNGNIDDRMRYYANDADGKVVNRREGLLSSNGTFTQDGMAGPANSRLVHANGQQIAEIREGYQGVFLNKPYNTQQIQSLAGRGGYDAGGGQTVAQAGDTLRTIAQRIYGTDQLWYVLADANGFGDADAEIGAGTRINTPESSVSSNNANTFKPYDPGAAIGSTAPGLPFIPPPPPQKCGALSKVIAIVVQVVVTAVVAYYSGNAEAAYAAGAAAGNHAGQVSAAMLNGQFDWSRWASMTANPFQGNANDAVTTVFDPIGHGMPGQIDYKSIAVSAAAAYTASYVGGANAYSYAATSYATNYQYAKWAGYDVSWSNRQLGQNLAAVAISQGVNKSGMFGTDTRSGLDGNTTVVARTDGAEGFSWTAVARNTALNFVAGAVTYGVGKALKSKEHWNTGDRVADAFGNALGTELAAPYSNRFERSLEEANESLSQINAELSAKSEQGMQSLIADFQSGTTNVRERTIAMKDDAADGAPLATSAKTAPQARRGIDGRYRDDSPEFASYSDRLIAWAEPLTDMRGLNQQDKYELAYKLANGKSSPYSPESVITNLPAVQAVSPDGSPALRIYAPVHYTASMEYRFSDIEELKTIGISATSLVAPTAADAMRRGTKPEGLDILTGPLKLVANVGIDAINLTTLTTPVGWALRGTDTIYDIPHLKYSNGEVTAAGAVESATLIFGITKQGIRLAKGVTEYAPFAARGLAARELDGWGVRSLGETKGAYSLVEPGPLADSVAATFSGGRYRVVVLEQDTVLYRAGTKDTELGQFFSSDRPLGALQSRVDKAVLPVWPGGGKSPIDTAFAVKIPKGTQVYVGEVGSQGGIYVGGTQQIVVLKPWQIDGVEVLGSRPLR